ncbi:Putative phage tail protein [Parasphingorhabdus marina DSM 22363]|uniref:Putative phage tail protein n=1 Tax=Parasphingorhabdus marina DSM 22363 TaxID=1123272 RepID=A0A1N6CME6_9SPHN|nr:phage tail protein [Parasphingorhabdus marina]SIN59619.1 Putative phage tail protein [Parasphingorhabdus marina DSM 22363]
MATILLTAAGSAIGGPVGAGIGALLGRTLDQQFLFKPSAREGARLEDLAVQTSSYGSPIPRIYGAMRVAGTVIWATDIQESRDREGGGKGRPATTTYSYSASFAVALSSRVASSVGRIWADGKLLRGAAGDFKSRTGFRFHAGHEDQRPDGLIAAAEGLASAPAFRGLAVAVFEDMDLADFGNRIPSLTFEIFADDGTVSLPVMVADVSDEVISTTVDPGFTGYSASGNTRADALRPIMEVLPISLENDGTGYRAFHRLEDVRPPLAVDKGKIVRELNGQQIEPPEIRTRQEAETATRQALRFHDPVRDYQAGLQMAFRPGNGRVTVQTGIPASLPAVLARSLAETAIWSAYQDRTTMRIHLAVGAGLAKPGTVLTLPDGQGNWRVRDWEFKGGAIELHLSRQVIGSPVAEGSTDSGRSVSEPDLAAGITQAELVDLPFALEAPQQMSEEPRLYAAASGDAGWRNAQVYASEGAGGGTGQWVTRISAPATMGVVNGILGNANPMQIDRRNSIVVTLHNSTMALGNADDEQLLAGRNMAAIGKEILQFGSAMPLDETRYRLSRLLRGLGGSEAELAGHVDGEAFVLVDSRLAAIEPQFFPLFQPVSMAFVGRDDEDPVIASLSSAGRALRPWSPVHPRWFSDSAGGLQVGWTRRSRSGLPWLDGVEVPLGEDAERYNILITPDNEPAAAFSAETSLAEWQLSSAEVQLYRSSGAIRLTLDIRQIGRYGWSDPLTIDIPL